MCGFFCDIQEVGGALTISSYGKPCKLCTWNFNSTCNSLYFIQNFKGQEGINYTLSKECSVPLT